MNAADPARQMALVSEACARGDLGQPGSSLAYKVGSTLQPETYDIAVRRDADGSAEHSGKVKWAQSRHVCQRFDIDGLIQVSHDMVSHTLKDILAQLAPHESHGF